MVASPPPAPAPRQRDRVARIRHGNARVEGVDHGLGRQGRWAGRRRRRRGARRRPGTRRRQRHRRRPRCGRGNPPCRRCRARGCGRSNLRCWTGTLRRRRGRDRRRRAARPDRTAQQQQNRRRRDQPARAIPRGPARAAPSPGSGLRPCRHHHYLRSLRNTATQTLRREADLHPTAPRRHAVKACPKRSRRCQGQELPSPA
jgi:hypothetical protein